MIKKILKKFKKNKFFKKIKRFRKLKNLKKKKGTKRKNLQLSFKTNKKIKKKHIIALSITIIIVLLLLIFNYFKIDTISILKKDSISNISISYNATDKFRGKALFLVKKEKIIKDIIEYQKNIKDVSITRIPPSTLKIKIESYKPIFKTTINSKRYLITQNGVVVPTNKQNDDLKEIIIKTDQKYNFPDYKKIFDSRFLKNIVYIKDKLNDNLLSINIDSIDYYPIERETHIKINNDTLIIFDLNSNIEEQIEKILIYNKEYFNLANPGIIYIDLRVKNKVFYCDSENEYKCQKSLDNIYGK